MSEQKDLCRDITDIIETLTYTIEMLEREENFYRRSANPCNLEASKSALIAIAGDINDCRRKLEAERQKLQRALADAGTA